MELRTLDVTTQSRILIEHITAKKFVIASRKKDTIMVSYFDDMAYLGTYTIPSSVDEDIKDLKTTHILDGITVLVNNPSGTAKSRVIWVPVPVSLSPFSGYYRYSNSEWINSIDPIVDYIYAASGHDSYGKTLHVYRMKTIASGSCFGRSDYSGEKKDFNYTHQYIDFPQKSYP